MKILGLLSGKGGVGKTSTAVNLAAGLNYFGENVVVVDGNLSTPNVGLHLGVPVVPVSLHHVLQGKKSIHDSIYKHSSGLKFVPGSLALSDLQNLNYSKYKTIKKLDCDTIILDGAAGLGGESLQVLEHSDKIVIVTNPELPSLTDALKTVKLAEELDKEVLGVVLTRMKEDDLDVSVRNVEALLEYPVIGVIPEDDTMREALSLKDAIVHTHPNSRAAQSYLKLAAGIAGLPFTTQVETREMWVKKLWNLIWRK
jgi:septum site-determining protein MinD